MENLLGGAHHITRGNVFSAGFYWGRYRKEEIKVREYIEDVIEFLESYKYRKSLGGNLLYGIQKLVGIGRALVTQQTLLLLDKPSSGMTQQEKEDLARFFLRNKHE